MSQVEVHNKLAGEIVAQIVRGPLETGGGVTDVMVLAESVLVGVALACVKLGGDERVLDVMFDAAKARLDMIREAIDREIRRRQKLSGKRTEQA